MPALNRRSLPILSIALTLAGTATLAGCYQPGGPVYSGNAPLTWISTEHLPKTISLIDSRTGETLWSVDVPPNKQLVVKFDDKGDDNSNEYMPSIMEWSIMERKTHFGKLENVIPAPPSWARRVEMVLRPQPEINDSSLTLTPEPMSTEEN